MENGQASETCWFCGKQRADGDSAAEVDMHRPIRYDPAAPRGLGLRDGWEPSTAYVPRCVSCKAAHDRTENSVGRGALVGLLVGVPLAALILFFVVREGGPTFLREWLFLLRGGIVGLIITGFVIVIGAAMAGGVVGWAISRAVAPEGVRDQGLATTHPNVRRKEEEGWKVGGRPMGEA
jgi:hypothetical protein